MNPEHHQLKAETISGLLSGLESWIVAGCPAIKTHADHAPTTILEHATSKAITPKDVKPEDYSDICNGSGFFGELLSRLCADSVSVEPLIKLLQAFQSVQGVD